MYYVRILYVYATYYLNNIYVLYQSSLVYATIKMSTVRGHRVEGKTLSLFLILCMQSEQIRIRHADRNRI